MEGLIALLPGLTFRKNHEKLVPNEKNLVALATPAVTMSSSVLITFVRNILGKKGRM